MDKSRQANSAGNKEQYLATIYECFAEIDRLREIMKQDDIEIARSQAQTQMLLAEIKALQGTDKRGAF